MSMHDMFAAIRKHWVLIVVLTVLGTVGMFALSKTTTPKYKADTSMLFVLSGGTTATDLNQGATYTRNQIQSFAVVAESPAVLGQVIEDLDLDMTVSELDSAVTVTTPPDTTILQITAVDTSASQSAAIANSVAENLVEQVTKLSATTNPAGEGDSPNRSTVVARIFEPATAPENPFEPNTQRNVLAGFLMGLIGGIALAYLREAVDTRVRRREDDESVLRVPVLAKISRRRHNDRGDILGPAWNSGTRSEEFRRFRTNLEYLEVGQEDVCVVFSSSLPGEGKTVTCASLAEVLAESGKRVLVIDADLRRPRLAQYFGLASDVGLTTVLIGRAALEDVVQSVGDNLDVLASGNVPPNPSELLASPAMRSLLAIARERYDIILVDSPPLLPVADAIILSRITAGVILVVDSRRVRRAQLAEAAQSVTGAGGVIRGVVLNRVRAGRSSAYQYESITGLGSRFGTRTRSTAHRLDPALLGGRVEGDPTPWAEPDTEVSDLTTRSTARPLQP